MGIKNWWKSRFNLHEHEHKPKIIMKDGKQVIDMLMPGQSVCVGIGTDGRMKIFDDDDEEAMSA